MSGASSTKRRSTFALTRENVLSSPLLGSTPIQAMELVESTAPPPDRVSKTISAEGDSSATASSSLD